MPFEATPKIYLQTAIGALVALASYFQAAGISHLIAATLLAPPTLAPSALPKPVARADRAAREREEHATSARAILENNPFDSTSARPLDARSTAVTASACGEMRAVIIMAAPDGQASLAIVTGPAGGAKLIHVGDQLAGKAVQLIEWNRVVLTSGSASCELRMFARAVRSERVDPVASDGLGESMASKIERVGPTEFNVDRQVVEQILGNPSEWMKLARLVPEAEDGRTVGIRLFGVRPDGALGALGVENGDRLQTINGLDITNPDQAMEAYTRLRRMDHLTVQVNRRGKNVLLEYRIR